MRRRTRRGATGGRRVVRDYESTQRRARVRLSPAPSPRQRGDVHTLSLIHAQNNTPFARHCLSHAPNKVKSSPSAHKNARCFRRSKTTLFFSRCAAWFERSLSQAVPWTRRCSEGRPPSRARARACGGRVLRRKEHKGRAREERGADAATRRGETRARARPIAQASGSFRKTGIRQSGRNGVAAARSRCHHFYGGRARGADDVY